MARDDERLVSSDTPRAIDIDRDFRDDWDEGRGQQRRVVRAGKMAGDRVRNPAGENLGHIEEIMIDVATGGIAYAVLSFGGFLGLGNKLFAIPWEALTLDQRDHQFILNIDRRQLENAPGFDKEHWPDMADRAWGSQVFAYYGFKPYWERDAASTVKGAKTNMEQNRLVCECGKQFNNRQDLDRHRSECPTAQSQAKGGNLGGKTRSMGSGSRPEDVTE